MLKTVIQNPVLARPLKSKQVITIRPFQATASKWVSGPEAESEYLRAQRKRRPTSPHLSIYRPQLTWYMSSAYRLTGVALGGVFYLGALTYLVTPAFGYHVNTEAIVSTFTSVSEPVKIAIKAILAAPFVYHSANGIRHLIWDAGKAVEIKGIYTTGYIVLTTTVAGTLYLAIK